MRDFANIEALKSLPVDMMGFIFYDQSPRFVEAKNGNFKKHPNLGQVMLKKAGVFVNAEIPYLLEKVGEYYLNFVQLHGNESPEYCQNLKSIWPDIKIIKAFAVGSDFDFEQTAPFEPYCDLFLFDTKGDNYGGNGSKFNWDILQKYQGMRPFLLSGGIGVDDWEAINNLNFSMLWGIDLNSGFEDEPGLKNIDNLTYFLRKLNQQV